MKPDLHPRPARPERADHGFTLVEAAIVFVLTSIALITSLTILGQTRSHVDQASVSFMNEDRAKGALAGMFDIMTEASINHVDTMMRVHGPVAANDLFSDRFTIPGVALRQCTSPTCAFHTRDDLSTFAQRYDCGYERCGGALGLPVVRGKTWPGTMALCPLDGSPTIATPRLDGVKFFLARDASGTFTKLANGAPYWGGLVFLFPCASHHGNCELRRYDVYVSDLLASPPTVTPGWNRFPPLSPSMVDLFDFGTDGTATGVLPDGKVPLTNALSDAQSESFTVGLYQGAPAILITKSIVNGPNPGGFPKRTLTLAINLETGETDFFVDHRDSNTIRWMATCNFTRAPRTIVPRISDLAISTNVSHPFDAATNPTGVSEPNVVRITIATSGAPEGASWLHHVESFQIKTRN